MGKALVIRDANFYANSFDTVQFVDPIPCTGLSLSKQSVSFNAISESDSIIATVIPSDTTDELIWETSDSNVAEVVDGIITCVGIGTTVITARCGEQIATCTVGYAGEQYVQTTGDSYIVTDISESPTIYDYEAVFSNDITTYDSSISGNGHVFSASNTYYPTIKRNASNCQLLTKLNGTEPTLGSFNSYTSGTFAKATGENDENGYHVAIKNEAETQTYVDRSVEIGQTYNASNKFVICGYYGSLSEKRFRLVGKLKYIKLSSGQDVVYHFVAAKKKVSANEYIYGLMDIVNNVFYQSDGEAFTGA